MPPGRNWTSIAPTNLHKQQAATQAEFDAAQARYNVAKAAVAEAEALSGYAKILAPFDGVVARKLADEGDLAMPGKPLLELEGRTGLRLVADVPSLLASHVERGRETRPCDVDTVPDPIIGTVAEISPAADPASRTVRVKVDLPATPGLRSGQFGRLAVPVSEATFLFVPPAALVRRGQLEILFVAADGKAQMRLVRAGKETDAGHRDSSRPGARRGGRRRRRRDSCATVSRCKPTSRAPVSTDLFQAGLGAPGHRRAHRPVVH